MYIYIYIHIVIYIITGEALDAAAEGGSGGGRQGRGFSLSVYISANYHIATHEQSYVRSGGGRQGRPTGSYQTTAIIMNTHNYNNET